MSTYKVVHSGLWNDVLERIEASGGKAADFTDAEKANPDRAVRKMVRFSSIERYRLGWVGDVEEPGEGAVRQVKTEDAKSADELANEMYPHQV